MNIGPSIDSILENTFWNSTTKELFPLLQSKGIAFGLLRAWKLRPLETQCSRLKLSKRSIEMWSLTSIPWNPMREILQFFEGEAKGIKCLLKSKRYTVSYTEKLSWNYCTSVYWKPCKYSVVIDPSFLHPSNLIKSPRVPFLLFYTQKWKAHWRLSMNFFSIIIKNHKKMLDTLMKSHL